MVYVATEYKYLKSQEYEKEKANPKVRLAVPNLKDDCLKRQQVREAFARFFCKAYVPEVPPLPECCIKKALEYKPTKSLKKRLPNIIDFTGDENEYVVFSDLWEHFNSSETPKEVGDALVKMGIMEKIIRVDGNSKAVRLGIKLKDFETRLYPTLIYKLERDNES